MIIDNRKRIVPSLLRGIGIFILLYIIIWFMLTIMIEIGVI
jgi:uncharacterized membrane protein